MLLAQLEIKHFVDNVLFHFDGLNNIILEKFLLPAKNKII